MGKTRAPLAFTASLKLLRLKLNFLSFLFRGSLFYYITFPTRSGTLSTTYLKREEHCLSVCFCRSKGSVCPSVRWVSSIYFARKAEGFQFIWRGTWWEPNCRRSRFRTDTNWIHTRLPFPICIFWASAFYIYINVFFFFLLFCSDELQFENERNVNNFPHVSLVNYYIIINCSMPW